MIPDIRQAARSAGVYTLLLHWEDYRLSGGRYSYDQIRELGGFPALRRAAANLPVVEQAEAMHRG